MTDMAHDGDDEASIEQRRIGRRRFKALQTGSLEAEESILLLGESCDNAGATSISSYEDNPRKGNALVVPSVDVMHLAPHNDENNATGLLTANNPGLLVVPAIDVDQNQFRRSSNSPASSAVRLFNEIGTQPNENLVQSTVGMPRETGGSQKIPDFKPTELKVVVGADVLIQQGNFQRTSHVCPPQGGKSLIPNSADWRSSSDDSGVVMEDRATKKATMKQWIGVPTHATTEVKPEDREVVEICDDAETQRDVESVEDDLHVCASNNTPLQLEDVEGVDMDLVRACQGKFISFLSKYPHLAEHPGVETMLILKLQKIFSVAHQVETDLQEHITTLKAQKELLAQDFHTKLILASRKKAARKLELQNSLDKAQCQTGDVQKLVNHSLLLELRAQARRLIEIRQNDGPVRSLDQPVNIPTEYLASIREALGRSETPLDLSEIASKTAVLRGKASSFTQKAERLRSEAERFRDLNEKLCSLNDDKLTSLAKEIGQPIV